MSNDKWTEKKGIPHMYYNLMKPKDIGLFNKCAVIKYILHGRWLRSKRHRVVRYNGGPQDFVESDWRTGLYHTEK